jgi:hypothetical protein
MLASPANVKPVAHHIERVVRLKQLQDDTVWWNPVRRIADASKLNKACHHLAKLGVNGAFYGDRNKWVHYRPAGIYIPNSDKPSENAHLQRCARVVGSQQ